MQTVDIDKISDKEKKELIQFIKFLRRVSPKLSKISSEQEEKLIRRMEEKVRFPVYSASEIFKKEFCRISINEKVREDKFNGRLFNLSELKYPPIDNSDKLDYNRASLKKQSVFYAGLGGLWATLENPYITGQLVTQSFWKQKEGTSLKVVPIFQKDIANGSDQYKNYWEDFQKKTDNFSSSSKELVQEISSFITDEFMKPVNSNIEYLFSAFFSNAFYETGIEAITYPSVPNDYYPENIVITPTALDTKFEFVKAEEYLVINDRNDSKGIFKEVFELIRKTKGINTPDPDTAIGWQHQHLATAKSYNEDSGELHWINSMN